jgi:hypothetical protein
MFYLCSSTLDATSQHRVMIVFWSCHVRVLLTNLYDPEQSSVLLMLLNGTSTVCIWGQTKQYHQYHKERNSGRMDLPDMSCNFIYLSLLNRTEVISSILQCGQLCIQLHIRDVVSESRLYRRIREMERAYS